MKKLYLIIVILLVCAASGSVRAQQNNPAKGPVKLWVYYFHPTERCPIDQSIEENTRKLMQNDFAKEIKDGTIKFQVLNTDDKANKQIVSKFDMNAQALYLVNMVNGKEVKKDLTEFAFSCGQSNPVKFKTGLRDEILKLLK
jgi:hypothetical protein